jgi:alkanesulfonate monooxygenase SsuD/methylene tetrahydromethanopterin reductase-like flavin-dependent oxidoreductase (luciferase family)
MKVLVEVTQFAAAASNRDLREKVRELEDLGATGVSVSDHIFVSTGSRPCDPMTTLAAVAALTDRLELQTVVMNSEWIHPALLLRQFAQLAVLADGRRVTAGLGAGWNSEEFVAMGITMAPYQNRMERLEETLQIASQLFRDGVASLSGHHVSVNELPISPVPQNPPRLLVGGGSDRILNLAGRYCDALDLRGDPRHGAMLGKTLAEARLRINRTFALTTIDDHVRQVSQVREASVAAGRPADSVKISVQLQHVIYGGRREIRAGEERLCTDWGHIPWRPLDQNPQVLMGEPRQMADALAERSQRFGLDQVILKEGTDVSRFCRKVLPLM